MFHAEELLKFGRRAGYPLCLLYLDVDDLKDINDGFGHAAGDAALRETACILSRSFRGSDIISRLGATNLLYWRWIQPGTKSIPFKNDCRAIWTYSMLNLILVILFRLAWVLSQWI